MCGCINVDVCTKNKLLLPAAGLHIHAGLLSNSRAMYMGLASEHEWLQRNVNEDVANYQQKLAAEQEYRVKANRRVGYSEGYLRGSGR